jgi:hypothetical protein
MELPGIIKPEKEYAKYTIDNILKTEFRIFIY